MKKKSVFEKRCLAVGLAACMLFATPSASALAAADVLTAGQIALSKATHQGDFVAKINQTNTGELEITGNLFIPRDVTLENRGTLTVQGDIYIFGTLKNYSKIQYKGTLYCLNYVSGVNMSAGDYDYGYYHNEGQMTGNHLVCRDNYLNVPIPGEPTPTAAPTEIPMVSPTATPTVEPTVIPTATPAPTAVPTILPTATPDPTATPSATETPAVTPSATPTETPAGTPIPTATPTTVPTRKPIVSDITKSVVTGLEKPLKMTPGTYHPFTVYGAGTANASPIAEPYVEGDTRWMPAYWTTETGTTKQANWKVGSRNGINDGRTIPIRIYFQKQVFKNGEWTQAGESYIKKNVYTEKYSTATPTPTAVPLKTPALKLQNAGGGVQLSWASVDNAKTYAVYRKNGSSNYKKLATVKQATGTLKYVDKTAKSGTTYVYAVKALHDKDQSKHVPKTILCLANPGVTLANNTKGVKITWKKVTGAQGYYVYRKLGTTGDYELLTTISKPEIVSYVDSTPATGRSYTYAVKAFSGKTRSAHSHKVIKYLASPKITKLSRVSDGVSIRWSVVSGSKGYYVYRKTGNGKYSRIATLNHVSRVSYKDTKAKKGQTYTYAVRSFNGKTLSAFVGKTIK